MAQRGMLLLLKRPCCVVEETLPVRYRDYAVTIRPSVYCMLACRQPLPLACMHVMEPPPWYSSCPSYAVELSHALVLVIFVLLCSKAARLIQRGTSTTPTLRSLAPATSLLLLDTTIANLTIATTSSHILSRRMFIVSGRGGVPQQLAMMIIRCYLRPI